MTRESKCPRKIAEMDKIHRELLDKMLHDDGTLITKKGLVRETHRPLSCKQISWIMATIFGYYVSRKMLYDYLSYLENKEKEENYISQSSSA